MSVTLPRVTPTCDVCGEDFEGRADARYCSRKHQQQAYRERQASEDAGQQNGRPVPSPASRLRATNARNRAIAATPLPVPSSGTFGKGQEGTGRGPVKFDPETGNVVGHGHDCLCELCDPIGRKAAAAK